MCLCSLERDASVAEEDIICYKLCYVIDSVKGKSKTIKAGDYTGVYRDEIPYVFVDDTMEVVVGNFEEHISRVSPFTNPYSYHDEFDINIGLHTYRDIGPADALAKTFMLDQHTPVIDRKLLLFECRIPKGAKYFRGLANDMHHGFCSNRLILYRVLKNYSKETE